jgi:hypothetical protein
MVTRCRPTDRNDIPHVLAVLDGLGAKNSAETIQQAF